MSSFLQNRNVKEIIVQSLPYAVFAIASCLLYGRSIGFDFLVSWDDYQYVVCNELIRNVTLENLKRIFTTPVQANYAPVHILSYWIDYAVWGLNPAGYHLFNVVLHALNACLVYMLVRKLVEKKGLAFFAAALFVVHPLNVENVAWISERKSLLSTGFFLLSFIAYMKFRERGPIRFYFLSILLLILSLLSKTSTVVLPLILTVYEAYIRKHDRKWLYLVPMFIISIMATAMTVWAHFNAKALDGDTVSPEILFGLVYPTMSVAYWKYVWLILFPFKLSGFYDTVLHHSFLEMPVTLSVIAGLTVFFAVYKKGDSQIRFWFSWFWICFLPTSNIIPIPVFYADRYMYTPAIGFFVIAGSFMYSAFSNAKVRIFDRAVPAFRIASTVIFLLFTMVSYERLEVWRNAVSFWEDTEAKSPNQFRVHMNLGIAYEFDGRNVDAEREYRTALAISPGDEKALAYLRSIGLNVQYLNYSCKQALGSRLITEPGIKSSRFFP